MGWKNLLKLMRNLERIKGVDEKCGETLGI